MIGRWHYAAISCKEVDIMFHQRLIQRYMPGNKAIKFLEDEGFYFRRVDGYPEDPTEGEREFFGKKEMLILESLNSRFSDENHMTVEQGEQICRKIMSRDKKSVFIQSWFWHERMSSFMWKSYGKATESPDCALLIVDRFKLGSYLDYVLPVGCRFEPIKYIQNKSQQREAFFTKTKDFECEFELRVSIDLSELIFFNKNILPEFNWPPRHMEVSCEDNISDNYRKGGVASEKNFKYVDEYGFILKAPLVELLEAIYIPVNASLEFSSKLDNLLAVKGYDFKCQRIDLPSE